MSVVPFVGQPGVMPPAITDTTPLIPADDELIDLEAFNAEHANWSEQAKEDALRNEVMIMRETMLADILNTAECYVNGASADAGIVDRFWASERVAKCRELAALLRRTATLYMQIANELEG